MSEPVGFYVDHQMTFANLYGSEARIYSIGKTISRWLRRANQTYGSSVGRNALMAIFAADTGGIGDVTCTEM
ncbi:hypothetical protein [Rhizobium leguminosarum]|uniref:hypothetical protein n=1 Tax=Rhizobium leguminosarum TaxID=384 RepID=UPI001C928D2F|nr:hypothetical protein [Rhizobium leguminosarum]MBY2950712.1 hypothetical protein [Rhizobium leguminosarum]